MKKISILSSLGILTLATLPVVAVVSCSSPTPESPATLESEVKNFNQQFNLKPEVVETSINDANTSINSAQTPQAKWDALAVLVKLPEQNANFSYVVKSSSIDSATSSLKVVITITQKSSNDTSQDTTLTVAGFKTTTSPTLDQEAQKFAQDFKLNTASQNITIANANTSINSASEGKGKWDALAALVDLPPLNTNLFKYEAKSSTIDTTASTLKVMLTITQLSDNQPKNVTLTITGFKVEASPALDKEVEKFDKSLPLKTTAANTTLEAANTSITNADAGQAKWDALAVLVNLPTTNTTLFKYDVKSTTPNTTNSTLKVVITITQLSDNKPKDANLTITGFKPVVAPTPTLDAEITKFQVSRPLKEGSKDITLEAANTSITTAAEGQAKWDALAALVVLPETSSHFTYKVKSTTPDTASSTLKVVITISEASGDQAKDATLTITGFKPATGPTLDSVAKDFTTSLPAVANTHISTVLMNLNNETVQENKLIILKSFVNNFPATPEGFGLNIGEATEATATSVNVAITITQKGNSATKPATFTITGLTAKSAIEKEADKFLNPFAASDPESLITVAIRAINETTNQSTKYATLSNLVDKFPQVSNTFDLVIGTAAQDASEATTMRVTFTIKEKANASNTIAGTIIVTGLKAETSEQELTRLAKEFLTNKPVPDDKASETAPAAAPKINSNPTLDTYYTRVTIAKEVTYTWKSSTAVDESVQVVVTVTNTLDQAHVDHTFSITGFTSILQVEADKFKISLAAKTAGTTTRLAARNINDVNTNTDKLAEINKLVDNFPTLDNNLYVVTIGTASVASDTATSITIIITVSEKPTAGSRQTKASPASATFTMTSLTAETAVAELTRIATEKLVPKNAATGAGLATTPQAAKAAMDTAAEGHMGTSELNKYYPRVNLGSGIIYAYGSSTIMPATSNVLNVTVGVINTNENSATIQFVIKITFPRTPSN